MSGSFLREIRTEHHAVLLYGNTDDLFLGRDMVYRDLESTLDLILREEGYRHILFYHQYSHFGAFCLDRESAEYYLPQPARPAQVTPTQPTAAAPAAPTAGKSGRSASGGRRRSAPPAYYGAQGTPAPAQPEAPQSVGTQPAAASATAPAAAQGAIRFSNPEWLLTEMLDTFRRKALREPDDRCALVFTDTLNLQPSQYPDISTMLQSELNGTKALVIFIVPHGNDEQVLERLSAGPLVHTFARVSNGRRAFNRRTCFYIGAPQEDEVRRMLVRRRAQEPGRRLTRLQDTALALARGAAGNAEEENVGMLRGLCNRVDGYLKGRAEAELGPELAVELFRQDMSETTAMQRLERPGWETARSVIGAALKQWESERPAAGPEPERSGTQPDRLSAAVGEQARRTSPPCFLLSGPAGVGKHSIGGLIGPVLREAGILRMGQTITVSKSQLVGPYVNNADTLIVPYIDRAEEGVLLIEGAEFLTSEDGGVQRESSGTAILRTLHSCMADPNRHFSVVILCAAARVEALVGMDRALNEQFHRIDMQDLAPGLLTDILIDALAQRAEPVSLSAELTQGDGTSPILQMMTRWYETRDRSAFANAAEAKQLAARAALKADAHGVLTREALCGVRAHQLKHEELFIEDDWFEPRDTDSTLDTVLKEFSEKMIGMKQVHERLADIAVTIEERTARGLKPENNPYFTLVGNPGTGKTTVARYLAGMLFALGALGTPEIVERNAKNLTYSCASTEVQAWIREAQDRKALLFIDEAHNFADPSAKDGFSCITAPFSDPAHPFALVLAGYPKEMEALKKLDIGFMSRTATIELPDYDAKELRQIMDLKLRASGWRPADEAVDALLTRVCEKLEREQKADPMHGNARCLDRLLGYAENRALNGISALHAARCRREGIGYSDPDYLIITDWDIHPDLLPPEDSESVEAVLAEMDRRIGCEDLKRIATRKQIDVRFAIKLGAPTDEIEPGYYAFIGPAGTGKSTGAELLTRLLYALGITNSNRYFKGTAKDMVANHVGGSQIKTAELLERSRGGVLMIDEAYTLTPPEHGGEGSFQSQALGELVGFMDDERNRRQCCIILAGYEDDMEALLRANEGLRSRITKVYFRAYSPEELRDIFCLQVEHMDFRVSKETAEGHLPIFERMCMGNSYSNGRTARTVAELAIARLKERVLREDIEAPEALRTILPEDMPDKETCMQLVR